MIPKDTSGPAFHIPGLRQDETFTGMTLRDYFAAKAMQAMLADATNPDPSPSSISVWAYRHADAMLKARAE